MDRDYRALDKAKAEILEGKLGIAKDRLQGLVMAYPDDLSLRKRLGDVYWQLGYPADAGKWWYLVEDAGPNFEGASLAYAKYCEYNPGLMLRRLKMPISWEITMDEFAKSRLEGLRNGCIEGNIKIQENVKKAERLREKNRMFNRVFLVGCSIFAMIIVFIFVKGLISILR